MDNLNVSITETKTKEVFMKKINKVFLIPAISILLICSQCYGAWDKTKPTDSQKLKDTPGLIRANWDAIELGTDASLQITNAKVASSAGIVDTKLSQITTAGKVSGASLTSLTSVPSGAGALPVANIPTSIPDSKLSQIATAEKVSGASLTLLGNTPSGAGALPVANLPASLMLQSDTTVNFNSGMTTAQIQALVDAQPKNLNGHAITFQFADGEYTFTQQVVFPNFINGTVNVQGNPSENASPARTTQAVYLNSSASACNTILVQGGDAYFSFTNFKTFTADGFWCLGIAQHSGASIARGLYLRSTGKTSPNTYGLVHYESGPIQVWTTLVENNYFGFSNSYSASMLLLNCSLTGTVPYIGINADNAVVNLNGSWMATATIPFSRINGGQVNFMGGSTGAFAWVTFNGTETPTIVGSNNVSSITDNGVGQYTVNFAYALPDALYAWAASCRDTGDAYDGFIQIGVPVSATKTASAVKFVIFYGNNGYDSTEVNFVAFR